MLFNWFTFTAQIVNFLILVLLLKRFLYKPIIQAMEERQQRVMAQLKEAEQKQGKADEERHLYEQKNAAFEQERNEKTQQVQGETDTLRARMLAEAQNDIQQQQTQWQNDLQRDQELLRKKLVSVTQKELFTLTRQILAELADARLEDSIVRVFLRRLQNRSQEERENMSAVSRGKMLQIIVRSSFDLSPETREALQQCLAQEGTEPGRFVFHTAPDLICGIELLAGDQKISWNIGDHASFLEEKVMEVFARGEKGES